MAIRIISWVVTVTRDFPVGTIHELSLTNTNHQHEPRFIVPIQNCMLSAVSCLIFATLKLLNLLTFNPLNCQPSAVSYKFY